MNPPLLPPDHPDAPKYWQNETTEFLAQAVTKYLADEELKPVEIQRIKQYLRQWAASPVWGGGRSLDILRLSVEGITRKANIDDAIGLMVDMGMDPL